MKQTKDILTRLDRHDGMTVPDGYFDDFAKRMSEMLPERPEAESTVKILERPTLWTRIRPYVYMAAMFAGIWCMFHVFDIYNGTAGKVSPKTEMASGVKGDLNTVKAAKAADNAKMSYKDSIEAGKTAGDNAPIKVAQ